MLESFFLKPLVPKLVIHHKAADRYRFSLIFRALI